MSEIIEQMIAEELAAANEKFPAFASTHEGWAVLKEEVEESKEDLETIQYWLDLLFTEIRSVHVNSPRKQIQTQKIRTAAINGIKELIQVAAMCDKFKALGEPEKVTVIDHYIKGQDEPIRYIPFDAPILLPKDKLNDEVLKELVDYFSGVAEKATETMDTLQSQPEWTAKIVPSDTPMECKILKEHRCGNCKFYNWTPVSEHAVCMNPKNQRTETKATWSCPEWEKGEDK